VGVYLVCNVVSSIVYFFFF